VFANKVTSEKKDFDDGDASPLDKERAVSGLTHF
jgi:hypothetical protein